MEQPDGSLSLTFHLNMIRLMNFDLPGSLFVRYYIFGGGGGGKRIRVDTHDIRSSSELGSFEYRGPISAIRELLEPHRISFELRWRRTGTVLRRITRSKLLGRCEVSWKEVLDSPTMSLEKRFAFVPKSGFLVTGLKSPVLSVWAKAGRASATSRRAWKDCDCSDCQWYGTGEDVL